MQYKTISKTHHQTSSTMQTAVQVIDAQGQELQARTQPAEYDALLDAFIAQYSAKENSRRTYRRSLRQFFAWVQTTGRDLKTLTKADILAYADYLLPADEDAPNAKSSLTAASYLTAVKLFYKFLADALAYPNVANGVKLPKRGRRYHKEALTEAQAADLVKEVADNATPRDAAIVNLLIRNGLRTIEVCRANVGDLQNRAGRTILYVKGKGRDDKADFVILGDKCKTAITTYLATRGRSLNAREPLFTGTSYNNPGGRLTTRTINGIAKTHLKAIGLDSKEYTAHSLRHTMATLLLEATDDLNAVQEACRHRSSDTTKLYAYHREDRRRLEAAKETRLDNIF